MGLRLKLMRVREEVCAKAGAGAGFAVSLASHLHQGVGAAPLLRGERSSSCKRHWKLNAEDQYLSSHGWDMQSVCDPDRGSRWARRGFSRCCPLEA